MSVRLIVGCDVCGAEPAHPLTIDVGGGARRVDACSGCLDAAGVIQLERLLEEYGAAAPPASRAAGLNMSRGKREVAGADWRCPDCGKRMTTRNSLLGHLVEVHSMTRIAASQAVPPRGKPVTCAICGYLGEDGTGMAVHQRLHRQARQ